MQNCAYEIVALVCSYLPFDHLLTVEMLSSTWAKVTRETSFAALYANSFHQMVQTLVSGEERVAKFHNKLYCKKQNLDMQGSTANAGKLKKFHNLALINSWVNLSQICLPRNPRQACHMLKIRNWKSGAKFFANMTMPVLGIGGMASHHFLCAVLCNDGKSVHLADLSVLKWIANVKVPFDATQVYLTSTPKHVLQYRRAQNNSKLQVYKLYVVRVHQIDQYDVVDDFTTCTITPVQSYYISNAHSMHFSGEIAAIMNNEHIYLIVNDTKYSLGSKQPAGTFEYIPIELPIIERVKAQVRLINVTSHHILSEETNNQLYSLLITPISNNGLDVVVFQLEVDSNLKIVNVEHIVTRSCVNEGLTMQSGAGFSQSGCYVYVLHEGLFGGAYFATEALDNLPEDIGVNDLPDFDEGVQFAGMEHVCWLWQKCKLRLWGSYYGDFEMYCKDPIAHIHVTATAIPIVVHGKTMSISFK